MFDSVLCTMEVLEKRGDLFGTTHARHRQDDLQSEP